MYVHAYANTGREKCVYARMPRERRAQITRRALRGVRERCITAIDGCLLQLTCERRAARTLRASRWRAVVECTRPVHGSTDPPLPPSPCAKEGTILSRDGCSIRQVSRISRATRPRRRDAIVDPRRPRRATQLNASQRACGSTSSVASHSSLEERRDCRRKSEHLRMKRHKPMWPTVDAIRRIKSYGCSSNSQRVS